MQLALSILILVATFGWALWFGSRHGAEPYYDWPATVYRLRLLWAARGQAAPAVHTDPLLCRIALGRIPGETEQQWAQRRGDR